MRQDYNRTTDILERRFIRRKLQETADEIKKESSSRMSSFSSAFWNNRSFNISDTELDYQHLKVHRFIDMKYRKDSKGVSRKKRSYAIHNKIVMGNYSQLTKELAVGFTESVKNELRKLED